MLKIDTEGNEFCLPCADTLEVEGVIVEREGTCKECESELVQCEFCGDYYEHEGESN